MELGQLPWLLIPALLALLILMSIKAGQLRRQLRRCQGQLQRETMEHERSEASFRQSQERYEDLFDHVSPGLFHTALDGRLLRANAALAASLGYGSPRQLMTAVPDAAQEFHIPECYTRAECRHSVMDREAGIGNAISYETRIRRRSGDPILAAVSLRLAGSGADAYLEGRIEDITERKRALEFAEAQRDLGVQLGAASSMAKALPMCLDAAARASGMEGGEIYLRYGENGSILASGRGVRPDCLRSMCIHAELTAALLESVNEPNYAVDQECEVGRARGCEEFCISRAILPIRHEGTRIGWMVLRSHRAEELTSSTRTALETIVAQMGSAIARLQVQEALAARQRELRTLFDSLDDFLFIVDSRGWIVDVNRALMERAGYSREELRGECLTKLYPTYVHSREAGALLACDVNYLSAPLLAKDGCSIPVETRLGLGRWEGESVIIGLGRDLTERRKAEEEIASLREKTALLKEIHHRIKNNLQIVCSLLSLQSSRFEPGALLEAFRESQGRIRAIALMHERLYQSKDLSRVGAGEYLAAVAEEVVQTYMRSAAAVQLQVETEAIDLNQDTVMPCGLLVNELVTNACKYAFPDGRSGRIRLSVKKGPDHTILLTLEDNGVGLPPGLDPSKTSTLGLQLVDDMVAQLKGSWTVARSGGTRFQIVFPVERD